VVKSLLRAWRVLVPAVLLALGSSGCNTPFDSTPFRYDPGPPQEITELRAEAGVGLVTLSWTPDAASTSYNVYYVSALMSDRVTRANATVVNVTTSSCVVDGLDNGVPYDFMVVGHNGYHGEGPDSEHVSATPGPFSKADLIGTWYFHTLVTGDGARWERGVLTVGDRCKTVDEPCSSSVSQFEASRAGSTTSRAFGLSADGDGNITQSGDAAWASFHGSMASRKNMMVATWEPSATSRAMTIFQRVKDPAAPEYSIADLEGTGQTGAGPTLYAYHQLSAGSSTEWEYSNCRIGKQGQFWRDDLRDVTYWDYGRPTYKTAPKYDFLWKTSSVGIDLDGLVQEVLNEGNHDVVFTGRMTVDRSVIVGVTTRKDEQGNETRPFLRIEQLCFIPSGIQEAPTYTLADLAGAYRFHELSASSWAHGTLTVTGAGEASFSEYADSAGDVSSFDTFRLYPYPDNGVEPFAAFANFATAAQPGAPHYDDASGQPYHRQYDYWTYGGFGQAAALPPVSADYLNEHASLSYHKDMLVLTRTDALGDSLIVGLK
jgi:hypothetical protein